MSAIPYRPPTFRRDPERCPRCGGGKLAAFPLCPVCAGIAHVAVADRLAPRRSPAVSVFSLPEMPSRAYGPERLEGGFFFQVGEDGRPRFLVFMTRAEACAWLEVSPRRDWFNVVALSPDALAELRKMEVGG